LGALLFVHQGGPTVVSPRVDRYHLPNTIGNLADRAVTFASLVFGGVMDKCPDLKMCLAHGGGYTCFGIGRMDRGWAGACRGTGVHPAASQHLSPQVLLYLLYLLFWPQLHPVTYCHYNRFQTASRIDRTM
jgi:aminocarboxymuconate-semialdehyde decarboxylase